MLPDIAYASCGNGIQRKKEQQTSGKVIKPGYALKFH
jgi:hypothetical protein